jgi:hypothetical protein
MNAIQIHIQTTRVISAPILDRLPIVLAQRQLVLPLSPLRRRRAKNAQSLVEPVNQSCCRITVVQRSDREWAWVCEWVCEWVCGLAQFEVAGGGVVLGGLVYGYKRGMCMDWG